ncbi:hypothetical protein DERP_011104 [Dermatophagoides pteronyssinus]|uniref:Uncharacterized protein n=1 Tax=Dermatophagoides pteronyssinus TaxID=6956 RepID=A0ABQ8J8T3_DERPT|nr:hypothetical protein DERP_011104 [Dermatophagoides pteronyssinus]
MLRLLWHVCTKSHCSSKKFWCNTHGQDSPFDSQSLTKKLHPMVTQSSKSHRSRYNGKRILIISPSVRV